MKKVKFSSNKIFKKKLDPKILGIPNINFSINTSPNKEKIKLFKKQRIERGFDDSETWSLCNTICSFIIPRLERYIEIRKDISESDGTYNASYINFEEELAVLLNILNAFKLLDRDDGALDFTESEQNQVNKGMILFSENITTLWW